MSYLIIISERVCFNKVWGTHSAFFLEWFEITREVFILCTLWFEIMKAWGTLDTARWFRSVDSLEMLQLLQVCENC